VFDTTPRSSAQPRGNFLRMGKNHGAPAAGGSQEIRYSRLQKEVRTRFERKGVKTAIAVGLGQGTRAAKRTSGSQAPHPRGNSDKKRWFAAKGPGGGKGSSTLRLNPSGLDGRLKHLGPLETTGKRWGGKERGERLVQKGKSEKTVSSLLLRFSKGHPLEN